MKIKIKTLDHFDTNYDLPNYETKGAAGADIRAMLLDEKDQELTLQPGEKVLVPTGMIMEIEEGYEVQIRPRSGLSLKTGLMVVNSPGTIDCDYRGEVKVILGNLGNKVEVIKHGDRVAQAVVAKIIQAEYSKVEETSSTERGEGGFGSTGVE